MLAFAFAENFYSGTCTEFIIWYIPGITTSERLGWPLSMANELRFLNTDRNVQ
jgi:hypothetical protein